MPFLTVFTRCCRRPKQLERNIESVVCQTSKDFEQLLVVDRTGRHDIDPILWANQQFERYADCVRGEYVYMLDDDGFLLDRTFIEEAKFVLDFVKSDVLLVKMSTYNLDKRWRIHPEPPMWNLDWEGGERPEKWIGAGYCVVVRADIWRRHIHHYQHAPGGDWHFITALMNNGYSVQRANVMAGGSKGRGCGVLFEKCDDNWFDPFIERYELEHVRDDAWRLYVGKKTTV